MDQSIRELKALRASIDQRIRVLSEKIGADFFEERFSRAVEDLKSVIDDRIENEDAKSLWEIYFELSEMTDAVLRTLSGFED